MYYREIPNGVDSFEEIINGDNYYVDKTHLIEKLVKGKITNKKRPGRYFLCRPRRFGKSLLVDTIRCLFKGKDKLFKGLYIYDKWDFSDTHPVIMLSLDVGGMSTKEEIHNSVIQQLEIVEKTYDLPPGSEKAKNNASNRLADVLYRLYESTGSKAVVLIDEYDKPVLDVLHIRDHKTGKAIKASDNIDCLRQIYGPLKGCKDHIHFIFITGISLFSKVHMFSGLNNLTDITIDSEFATICGYTEDELKAVFAPEVKRFDFNEICQWYDGYSWDEHGKAPMVFCPQSVLNLFRTGGFKNWWYQESVPEYLYEELRRRHLTSIQLTDRWVSSSLLNRFDVDGPGCDSLLFQCGYLTIRASKGKGASHKCLLRYPNLEVKQGIADELLKFMLNTEELPVDFSESGLKIIAALTQGDLVALQSELESVFSGMPHYWHDQLKKQKIPEPRLHNYEFWYASLLYTMFIVLADDVKVEETSHHGRSDLVVSYKGRVYVMELKCGGGKDKDKIASHAMNQIRDRGYAEKYKNKGCRVYAIAMVYCYEKRNLVRLEFEEMLS